MLRVHNNLNTKNQRAANKLIFVKIWLLVHLFLTRFLEQMPIMHPPTFSVVQKPHFLVSAMQAAGALYVKTPTAINFITNTLTSARDEILAAFVSSLDVNLSTPPSLYISLVSHAYHD